MTDHLSVVPEDASASTSGWRFSIIPPRRVWADWYRSLKTVRRPAGTLAIPAVATTGSLHFTHVLHHGDTLVALWLATLVVGYDAVALVCRTWEKNASARAQQESAAPGRRAA